ncbi:MAG: metallophosphoesterase [Tannerella sp.]|nr:metallophosphoesterase [Tannerella sp.]
MNEILIVPDVHGRKFWEPALDYMGEVIFLGDYTDPYPAEGITDREAWQNLLRIVDFKRQNPDRVTLLAGNHELHYYNRKFRAGRFSDEYYEKYHDILTGEESAGLFRLCRQIDRYLFIHAGVTKGWYDLHGKEFLPLGNDLETQLNRLFIERISAFCEVSFDRGGWDDYGSPLWADIYEYDDEKEPFDPNIIQIVGHTQLKTKVPLHKKNVWLTDNRRLYLFVNGELRSFP